MKDFLRGCGIIILCFIAIVAANLLLEYFF